MRCESCGSEVTVYSGKEGTSSYELVNKKLSAFKKNVDIEVPFRCDLCGAIKFDLTAVRDVVFLYPKQAPEKIGSIYIPDEVFVGGNTREKHKEPIGVILTAGKGCVDVRAGKYVNFAGAAETGDIVGYNKYVPWKMDVDGPDGRKHTVIFCGIRDLLWKME